MVCEESERKLQPEQGGRGYADVLARLCLGGSFWGGARGNENSPMRKVDTEPCKRLREKVRGADPVPVHKVCLLSRRMCCFVVEFGKHISNKLFMEAWVSSTPRSEN